MARAARPPAKKAGKKTTKKTGKKAAKKQPKAGTQTEIDGARPKKNPRIEKLAVEYERATAVRQEASREEVPAKEALIAAMQAVGVEEYELANGDRFLLKAAKYDIKIKKAKNYHPGAEA